MENHNKQSCGFCESPIVRNNYFYGKELTVRDFCQEQFYMNNKRWLLNRMLFGWGVVQGFDVCWNKTQTALCISGGFAIDCCGHEILVCDKKVFTFDELLEKVKQFASQRQKVETNECKPHHNKQQNEQNAVRNIPAKEDQQQLSSPIQLAICLRYRECLSEEVRLPPFDCDQTSRNENNRILESYQICLKPFDEEKWNRCQRKFDKFETLECLDRYKTTVGTPLCNTESIHHYLCGQLKHEFPDCECCDCIILAVITWEQNNNNPDDFLPSDPDCCAYRRLVYRNPLLYNMIDSFHSDLPHIVNFSWRKWSKQKISIADFASLFEGDFFHNKEDKVTKISISNLWIDFDRHMRRETLNNHSVLFTILLATSDGYLTRNQIPIELVNDEKIGHCYRVKIKVSDVWESEELGKWRLKESKKGKSLIEIMLKDEEHVFFEIVIRGSLVLDENDISLDADYIGNKLPTGNGTRGGEFVDWMQIVPETETSCALKAYDIGQFG